jgi:hypothetical protein
MTQKNLFTNVSNLQNLINGTIDETILKALLAFSPIAVRITKEHGNHILFANYAYAELVQTDIREIIGTNPTNCYKDKKRYI